MEGLPVELLEDIFGLVSYADIVALMLTCLRMKELICNSQRLWLGFYSSYFGGPREPQEVRLSWMELFKRNALHFQSLQQQQSTRRRRASESSLQWIIAKGHCSLLLSSRCPVAIEDWVKGTYAGALCIAATKGYEEVVVAMIEHGASIESRDRRQRTLLTVAAAHGHLSLVKRLVARGAKVNQLNKFQPRWVLRKKDVSYHNSSTWLRDDMSLSPFAAAVDAGHRDVVEYLYSLDASIINSFKPMAGITPLYCAVRRNRPRMVDWLLANGAEVNKESCLSLLSAALQSNDVNMVRRVLDWGVTMKDEDAYLLHAACRKSKLEIIHLLFSHPTCAMEAERILKTSLKDATGCSVLQAAALRKPLLPKLVTFLMDKTGEVDLPRVLKEVHIPPSSRRRRYYDDSESDGDGRRVLLSLLLHRHGVAWLSSKEGMDVLERMIHSGTPVRGVEGGRISEDPLYVLYGVKLSLLKTTTHYERLHGLMVAAGADFAPPELFVAATMHYQSLTLSLHLANTTTLPTRQILIDGVLRNYSRYWHEHATVMRMLLEELKRRKGGKELIASLPLSSGASDDAIEYLVKEEGRDINAKDPSTGWRPMVTALVEGIARGWFDSDRCKRTVESYRKMGATPLTMEEVASITKYYEEDPQGEAILSDRYLRRLCRQYTVSGHESVQEIIDIVIAHGMM